MNELESGSQPLQNTRWEAFCIAYTGGFRRNAAAAYVAAGYKPKKPEIATVNAIRLLAKANIQARVEYLNNEALKIERLHARDAVSRLAAIATAKLSDYMDEYGRIDPAKVADPNLSAAVLEMTQEDTENGLKIKIKLKDDMRALELLGLTDKANEATQNNVFIIEV
ncbi:MAG: Terminase small subunit [Candidatus Hydrogenedentes bacterium ADurb.Bin170]|nr:MAG: Terminase small subunit [Candidatus Hydrogenedentes bacterium ADurb.Bin170]